MKETIKKLLLSYQQEKITLDEVLEHLRRLPYEDLGFAKVDTHRHLRKPFPETVYCKGKTTEQIIQILQTMLKDHPNVLATKADAQLFEAVHKKIPDATYHADAQIIVINREHLPQKQGTILIITAGTSDIPIAEEAVVTAKILGNPVETCYDVGVAGVHRLFDIKDKLTEATVVIVIAGMDGALPSIVGGLTSKPVIAVPTSKGYGASFEGIAPLLTMMNSCAEGVVVVNIDNGFGAGYFASLINR